MDRKQTGKIGEDMATDFLKKSGYRIIERNYRCNMGEIDIIAVDKDVLTFVEVRTKNSSSFCQPQQTVTSPKQKKLQKLALYFLAHKKVKNMDCRFDVVAIDLSKDRNGIELIKNAFW
ncbi:MAG: YraN family protein [Nitrospinae bacterium]|nr:YraN family protein [Nitrospinota bacterium]